MNSLNASSVVAATVKFIGKLTLALNYGSAIIVVYSSPILSSLSGWQSVLAYSVVHSCTTLSRAQKRHIVLKYVWECCSYTKIEWDWRSSARVSITIMFHIYSPSLAYRKRKADNDKNTRSERDKSMIDITELPNHSEWIGLPLPLLPKTAIH